MPAPAPALVLDALDKTFVTHARVAALNSCSLHVDAGECVAILGASGCGKTTLLRIVAGLEEPDRGRILFGERDVTRVATQRRGVGFVFQHDALFARSSAYANVAFGLRGRSERASDIDARVRAIAGRTRADALLDRRVSTLSGGERQRIALARALAPEPAVLLLDEPLSRLDAALRLQLRREVAEVARSRTTTMLYVTHDQDDAMALGDRIAVMREGTIAQVGTARELFERPKDAFVASAIGSPAIALIDAAWVFARALPGERCGLRPGAVRLSATGTLHGIVRTIEDFVHVAYAYVEGEFGELVAEIDSGPRPTLGERVSLTIDIARALRFAADGSRVDTIAHV